MLYSAIQSFATLMLKYLLFGITTSDNNYQLTRRLLTILLVTVKLIRNFVFNLTENNGTKF